MDAQAVEQELKGSGAFSDGENMLLMDIEGGEYDVVLNSRDLLRNFSQICLELHSVPTSKHIEALPRRLNQTHTLIRIHANNWVLWPDYKSYTGRSGIKHELPDLLELTYVRNDTFSTKRMSKEKSPTPMDKKNIPNFREVEMGWWFQ